MWIKLKIRFPQHIIINLTPREATAILDAITDERLLQAHTFREQCYILTTLLHDIDSEDIDKIII